MNLNRLSVLLLSNRLLKLLHALRISRSVNSLLFRRKIILCGSSLLVAHDRCMASIGNHLHTWSGNLNHLFGLSGQQIQVFTEPAQFYKTIMAGIASSKKRIVLSALYLGNGSMERDMVDSVQDALNRNADLRVHILLDYTRASRGENDSRSMLAPLLKRKDSRVTVSLFHTPNLRGIMKKYLPDRFNELLGLQHIKAYVFDNSLVLSGANLSHDYFTNRQDRCLAISDAEPLCDFFDGLIECIASFSYQVTAENKTELNRWCKFNPSQDAEVEDFCLSAKHSIQKFLSEYSGTTQCCDSPDTFVCPLLQMDSFSIVDDHKYYKQFMSGAPRGSNIYLSTAYFNPLEEYQRIITSGSVANFHILAASPQANGFFTASGVARYIPLAYTYYEKTFLDDVLKHNQSARVRLLEFGKLNWTFHVKGLWYYEPGASLPCMTMIGSSNYGYRSVHRDLEAQVIILTENASLQQALHRERENIYSNAEHVSQSTFENPTRRLPLWAPLVAHYLRNFF